MDHGLTRRLLLVATLLTGPGFGTARPAAAQIVGLPVHFSPSAQPGLRLFGDFAIGDKPVETYFGGRALLNLSYVSLGVAAGERRDADAAWGTSLALNLFRGATRRFSLSLDAGYGENRVEAGSVEVDVREIPLGVGLALEPRVTGFDIEPWVGLRAHVRRSDMPGASAETKVGIGLSGGVNLRTGLLTKVGIPLPGFGLHLAMDYLNIPRAFAGGRSSSLIVNAGLNYLFEFKRFPQRGIIGPPCDPTSPC